MAEENSFRKMITRSREFCETAYNHTNNTIDALRDPARQFNDSVTVFTRPAFSWFHEQRHTRPWMLVGATATATAICSFPFGPSAAARNTILATILTTCVVNPEYVVKVVRDKEH